MIDSLSTFTDALSSYWMRGVIGIVLRSFLSWNSAKKGPFGIKRKNYVPFASERNYCASAIITSLITSDVIITSANEYG